jgi:hypothetical protein
MTLHILQYAEKALAEAVNNENYKYLCTMETSADPQKWIQLRYDTVNLYYPCGEEPVSALQKFNISLPAGVTVTEWETNVYCTLEHDANQLVELTGFIELYVEKIMECAPDDTWTINEEMVF